MTILKEVLAELLGMFLSDARMSAAILAVVAVAAGLIDLAAVDPLVGGGVLLAGCLTIVLGSVRSASLLERAKQRNSQDRHDGPDKYRPGSLRGAGQGRLRGVARWLERMRQRRALKDLEDRLLDDIGVSKDAAEAESRRLD